MSVKYHSVIVQGKRYKMAEGSAQMTNVQLVLDTLNREQAARTVIEARRLKPGYANHPVISMLLNLIILGAVKKV
jgi:hypothetical protein